MVLESVISNVSPPRPSSLSLKNSWNKVQEENNNDPLKMVGQSQDLTRNKKKKKRRAADAGVRKFEEIYAPTGEDLGSGSQGSVSTYVNKQTNVEYAVKVR